MRSLLAIAAVSVLALAGCIPEAPPPPAPVESADAGATPAAPDTIATDSKSLLKTVEAMKDQLKDRPRDFNVDIALANLFYDNGKYIDAIEFYTGALGRIEQAEQKLLAGGLKPGALPDACKVEKLEPSPGAATSNAVENAIAHADAIRAANPAGADACLAQFIAPLAGAHARRGNSWYLIGNTDKAKVDHVAALKLDPENPEALFFSGAIELETARGDPAKLDAGRAFWERLLKAAPNHPRAELVRQTIPRINELFGARPGMDGHPPVGDNAAAVPALPAGMADAMQKVEHTPEMEAQLDKTMDEGEALLAKGEWQKALDTFKQVMPLRPNGRTALGMGIALRELGKPTAERVLTNATQMPGGDPARAKYELGVYYEKGDPTRARALYQEVADDPKIGAQAKARLAGLK